MTLRKLTVLIVLMLAMVMSTGCDKAEKALDTQGLTLGKDLTGLLGEATKLLGGITDLDSAKAALPQLGDMDSNLGDIIGKVAKLSPESKSSLVGLAKSALPAFEGAIAKVNEIPGVGDTLKPTLDSIMAKVQGLL